MKRLHLAFLATLLLPTALWLAADTLLPEPFTYFSFRSVFMVSVRPPPPSFP